MNEVYEQVILTCTTINVVIMISCVISWIVIKIQDHREKKREEQDKKNKQ